MSAPMRKILLFGSLLIMVVIFPKAGHPFLQRGIPISAPSQAVSAGYTNLVFNSNF